MFFLREAANVAAPTEPYRRIHGDVPGVGACEGRSGRRDFAQIHLAVALLPGSLRLPAKAALPCAPWATCWTRYIDRRWPGARTSGIARTRLIDDWIEQSVGQADQVVLLGAGFDTRAWRLQSLDAVRIYEVDHPDTAKREAPSGLQAAGADLNRVTFVAVDFEIDDFDVRLREAGFDRNAQGDRGLGRRQPVSHRGRGLSA